MHSDVTNIYDGRPTFIGVVYKKTIGNYIVHTDGQALPCEISNRMRKQLIYPTADPASLRHRVQKVVELEHMYPAQPAITLVLSIWIRWQWVMGYAIS